ncbi:MAG TPA: zf-TFIIB domain-containing protein [Candidatus Acidoferrales bacterium]|jgi:Zn-finger nucleic acid-binding protein|nr:zf-TFIIB domain-containing protein [Candidatus Acidoferrales bacterium]
MQSPVHTDTAMELKEIEPGLSVYTCPKSGGVWIPYQNYLAWKQRLPAVPAAAPTGYAPVPADDSTRRALVCPESGRLLVRYKVGHGLNFHIDASTVTNGVWLDQGEWEALKDKGLHAQLNHIFTASYQREIRSAEYEQKLAKTFSDRIGAADFKKVTDFKTWLVNHPKRRDICCYLLDNLEGKEAC